MYNNPIEDIDTEIYAKKSGGKKGAKGKKGSRGSKGSHKSKR